jgi:hypothetical protein
VGQVVRSVPLVAMAAITYWSVGTLAAAVLLVGAAILGAVAFMAITSP